MNYKLSLFIFLLISLSCKARDNEKFARDFLKEKCNFSISSLVRIKKTEDYVILASRNRSCFVALADEKYDDVLPNPVLAYSTESYILPNENKSYEADIFEYYARALRSLKKDSVVYNGFESFTGEKRLKTVVFGQQKFDMLVIGNRGVKVAGCVPTSATQMMYYHKWPEIAHGKYIFYRKDEGAVSLNVEGMHLAWPEDCSIYNGTTRRLVVPHRFLAINGMLFEADFGNETTTANMQFCKRSFISHYGYSRKMVYVYNQDEALMLEALRKEIDADRPVMVGRWRHAFICDGYNDDYFHFNLGWYGYRDGYYRLFPDMGKSSKYDGWEMILGIMPECKTSFTEKTVTLSEAGTLGNFITDEDYDNLGKLKVVGPIDGKDVTLLRNLSGGASVEVPISKRGVLSELDLSEAVIVASKDYYRSYWEFSDESKSYEEKHVWSDSWQEEIVPKKVYVTRFHTRKDDIGTQMFQCCDGLEKLVIPNSVFRLGWKAFSGCTTLKSITIPPSVKYANNNIFDKCKSLLDIHCSKNALFIKVDSTGAEPKVNHPFVNLYPYTNVIAE